MVLLIGVRFHILSMSSSIRPLNAPWTNKTKTEEINPREKERHKNHTKTKLLVCFYLQIFKPFCKNLASNEAPKWQIFFNRRWRIYNWNFTGCLQFSIQQYKGYMLWLYIKQRFTSQLNIFYYPSKEHGNSAGPKKFFINVLTLTSISTPPPPPLIKEKENCEWNLHNNHTLYGYNT